MDIFALVLEDEAKFQLQIFNALKKIHPQIKVRFFTSLESFSNWIATFVKDGISVVETAGARLAEDSEPENMSNEKTIRLLVCKSESLGTQSISLLNKTIELFARKNLCTPEEKTSVIITAFDHQDYDIRPMEVAFINNIIFKPFDALILEEHMRFAFIGHKKPADANFKSNKLEAQVEMVKDIACDGFSDLGFLTTSEREVRTGETNKFYSSEFSSGNVRSVMANCIKSVPKSGGGFLCWMEYFGLENEQIKKFRKELINEFPSAHLNSKLDEFKKNFLILDSLGETDLASSLKRFFPHSSSFYYKNWNQFLLDSSPGKSDQLVDKDIPIPHDFILVLDGTGHFFLDQDPKSETENVFGELFKDLKKKDFLSLLAEESKKVWLEALRSSKIEFEKEPILILNNIDKKFLVRLTKITKAQNQANLPTLELMLSEVSMADKIEYLQKLSPLPKDIHMIIASMDFMNQVLEQGLYPDAKRMLLVENQLSDKEKKSWAKSIYDVFEVPTDRNYLVKKIYLAYLDKSTWWIKHFNENKTEIQAAQQIQIDEISEAGLAFKYHRPLSIGTFRRFYLWTSNENELRDYHASCNYYDELKEGKTISYVHHFVFFAMKDFYLKNIRLWVRENYIQNKSKES